MASKNRLTARLAEYLIEHGLSPEAAADKFGVSGMTLRRALDGKDLSLETKMLLAKKLRENPEALWPHITPVRKRPKAAA